MATLCHAERQLVPQIRACPDVGTIRHAERQLENAIRSEYGTEAANSSGAACPPLLCTITFDDGLPRIARDYVAEVDLGRNE